MEFLRSNFTSVLFHCVANVSAFRAFIFEIERNFFKQCGITFENSYSSIISFSNLLGSVCAFQDIYLKKYLFIRLFVYLFIRRIEEIILVFL